MKKIVHLAVMLLVIGLWLTACGKGYDYKKAVSLCEKGQYEEAREKFKELGDYKDSAEKVLEIKPMVYEEERKKADVGSLVHFGSYEQDANDENGKEDIEWIVLAKEDSKLLLISKYALDCQPYNNKYEDITWEQCTLRQWLNNDFINNAFSEKEKQTILITNVTADKNPEHDTDPGNDTEDKIFLLSINEANKYFKSSSERECHPTEYAKKKNAYIDDFERCDWWLRTAGADQLMASLVVTGAVFDVGDRVDCEHNTVRPTLWINLDSPEETYKQARDMFNIRNYEIALQKFKELGNYKDSAEKVLEIKSIVYEEERKKASVGSLVHFGSYEQDANDEDGKEDIEWLVLAKEDNKLFLISKDALDCQPYNNKYEDITWEQCTLRQWLNNDFINNAFSEKEKQTILTTKVIADKNPEHDTDPGNDTEDKIFLLSINEANKYFESDSKRQCKPTQYAKKNNADTDFFFHNCSWCLRTPGRYLKGVSFVNGEGSVNEHGHFVDVNYDAVRPALWVNLES